MKGTRSADELYGVARAMFVDRSTLKEDMEDTYRHLGSKRQRLVFLGDRLLDRLEQRMLRDQIPLPPGLIRQILEYQMLLGIHRPRVVQTTAIAHDLVLDVQSRVLIRLPETKERRPRQKKAPVVG